jgi:hypothetical protein
MPCSWFPSIVCRLVTVWMIHFCGLRSKFNLATSNNKLFAWPLNDSLYLFCQYSWPEFRLKQEWSQMNFQCHFTFWTPDTYELNIYTTQSTPTIGPLHLRLQCVTAERKLRYFIKYSYTIIKYSYTTGTPCRQFLVLKRRLLRNV